MFLLLAARKLKKATTTPKKTVLYFVFALVRKIKGIYYLNRAEAIEYLIQAYSLKWCNTRWSSGHVRISWETSEGKLSTMRVLAYKTPGSNRIRLKKNELDAFFRI